MRTQCTNCGMFYDIKDENSGKKTQCKKCGTTFVIEEIVDLEIAEEAGHQSEEIQKQPEVAAHPTEATSQQAPQAKKKKLGCLGWLGVIAIVLYSIGAFVKKDEDKKTFDWADKYRPDAVPKCSTAIERLAKYDYKWGSLSLEYVPRFPYPSRVTPDADTVIRLEGSPRPDALQFKNAFGVWIPMNYSCDYNTQTKKVVDVVVQER